MFRSCLLTLGCALSYAAIAAPENYTIEPTHTYPNFLVNHLGFSTLHGRFDKSSGKFSIDREAKSGSVELTIEAASVDTAHQYSLLAISPRQWRET
jgi:polyisoprenoid-binding protein YceI